MADIYNINNVPFCASSSTVNTVTQSHTATVDNIIKNCETEDCYTCGPFLLSVTSDNCPVACGESCTNYYSVAKKIGCDPCNLVVGMPLFTDANCTPAANGYYSGNPCEYEQWCQNCYQVSGGFIVAITLCNSSECTSINTNITAFSQGCGTNRELPEEVMENDFQGVCASDDCTVRYTDGTPGSLQPLDHLYSVSNCECTEDNATPVGFYKAYASTCEPDGVAQCVEVDENCRIRAVQPCRQ